MSETALFIDITDLYYKLLKQFQRGKLDYGAYLAAVEEMTGASPQPAIAYGCQTDNEANSFIGYLRSLGFITKYKKPYVLRVGDRKIRRCNWQAGMSVDIFKAIKTATTIVVCSSNPDMFPVLKMLKEDYPDIKVIVFSCQIPSSFQKIAECVEIDEKLLETD